MASILQSGDGRSFETAYQVISIAEEYAILETLNLRPGAQTLCSHGEQHFDVFQCQPASPGVWGLPGEVRTPCEPNEASASFEPREIYFNVDLFYGSPAHLQLVDALTGGPVRRVVRISIGAWLLYFTPLLMCLASLGAATVNFFLMLLHAGWRRCQPSPAAPARHAAWRK